MHALYPRRIELLASLSSLILCHYVSKAWITSSSPLLTTQRPPRWRSLLLSSEQKDVTTTKTLDEPTTTTNTLSDIADDDEYEYIEYESLTEAELVNSEWLVGTNYDSNTNQISETWARCIVDKDGKNVVVWGDTDQTGTWSLDVPSQFFSMSKEGVLTGKRIWACTVEDYYYLQGTVRGWSFWQPASVVGQWQARRLGVDPDEAGVPPWFSEEQTEETTVATTEEKSTAATESDITE